MGVRSFLVVGSHTSDYLGGHGDLVSRLIIRGTRVTIWVIEVINLLTKSPDPPSTRFSG